MVVLRLGKIDNRERKFVPTKLEYLKEYLDGMEEIEEYELTQTFKDGYKYRRYNDHGEKKYTRNKKEGDITDVIEISEEEFNNVLKENGHCIRKIRKYYNDGPYEIDVDYFIEPLEMILVEVASDTKPLEQYVGPRGFVDVSDIELFQNKNIYNGSIRVSNVILEGTDGVGKSSTIEYLLRKGIIAQDRCVEVFSGNMEFDIRMEDRCKIYHDYLKNHDVKVIFLINNSREELESRINKREKLSEYDLEAFRYNQLYLDTYNYMIENELDEKRLFCVDCTFRTLEEQVKLVEDVIFK